MDISSSISSSYVNHDHRGSAGAIDTQNEGLKKDVPGSVGDTVTIRSVDAGNAADRTADATARGEKVDKVDGQPGAAKDATQAQAEEEAKPGAEKEKVGDTTELSPEDLQLIDKMAARDREVRAHEAAHAAVGGALTGGASYEFQRGPDGRMYAAGGEVSIDTGAISGDPKATIEKMQTVIAAANAPAEPSSQDRKVAAQASVVMGEAVQELAQLKETERAEDQKKAEEANSDDPEQGTLTEAAKENGPEANRSPEAKAADSDEPEITQSLAQQTEAQSSMDKRIVETGAFSKAFPEGVVINNMI